MFVKGSGGEVKGGERRRSLELKVEEFGKKKRD